LTKFSFQNKNVPKAIVYSSCFLWE